MPSQHKSWGLKVPAALLLLCVFLKFLYLYVPQRGWNESENRSWGWGKKGREITFRQSFYSYLVSRLLDKYSEIKEGPCCLTERQSHGSWCSGTSPGLNISQLNPGNILVLSWQRKMQLTHNLRVYKWEERKKLKWLVGYYGHRGDWEGNWKSFIGLFPLLSPYIFWSLWNYDSLCCWERMLNQDS